MGECEPREGRGLQDRAQRTWAALRGLREPPFGSGVTAQMVSQPPSSPLSLSSFVSLSPFPSPSSSSLSLSDSTNTFQFWV